MSISAAILSLFALISRADFPIRNVMVFQAFTQKPVMDWDSASSSRTFFFSSAISCSIWWTACAFIASLNRNCASAAIVIDLEARSTDTPRSP